MAKTYIWNVFLGKRKIDMLFQSLDNGSTIKETADEIKRSLINHDGYDPGIRVAVRR